MMDYTPEQSKVLVDFIKSEINLKEAIALSENLKERHSRLRTKCLSEFGLNPPHEVAKAKRYMEAFPEVFK